MPYFPSQIRNLPQPCEARHMLDALFSASVIPLNDKPTVFLTGQLKLSQAGFVDIESGTYKQISLRRAKKGQGPKLDKNATFHLGK